MSAAPNKKPSFALGLILILLLLAAVVFGGMWVVQAAFTPRMSDAKAAAESASAPAEEPTAQTEPTVQEPEPQEPKPFALPKPYLTMRRMYAYLTKHRCIDRDVVTAFVQEKLLYEDDPHHNCVFVGLDENGAARHAHLRSTSSQGKVFRINVEGSDIKHSFHKNGTDRSLYVFEAPIDLLSHITLYPAGWLEHSYVACCGTSIQPVLERLRQNPKLDTVYLCLDNDEAGEDACDGMLDTLEDMGYDVEGLRPEGKDWNDDLRAKRGGHG